MRHRQGFTIVEMLVSMALIVFIMAILAEAFTAGLNSFSQLKAIGDMQERMRVASVILRRDLTAEHFGAGSNTLGVFVGGKLSDQNLVVYPPPGKGGFFRVWQGSPVSNVNTANYVYEGSDADGNPSYRAVDHALHFTIHLTGSLKENYFTAAIPTDPFGAELTNLLDPNYTPALPYIPDNNPVDFRDSGIYNSHWAEVAYFLQPINGAFAGTTQLFGLYRRQRVIVPSADNSYLNPPGLNSPAPNPYTPIPVGNLSAYYQMSVLPDPTGKFLYFNCPGGDYDPSNNLTFSDAPGDLTIPEHRFGGKLGASLGNPPGLYSTLAQELPGASQAYDDLLLGDVISFQVRMMYIDQSGTLSSDSPANTPAIGSFGYNGIFGFTDVPPNGNNSLFNGLKIRVFDTWSSAVEPAPGFGYDYSGWATPNTPTSIPLRIHVLALQITIRVWDFKAKQARQITLVQDM